MFTIFSTSPIVRQPFNLSERQTSELSRLSRAATTQEEKINLIFEVYRRQLDSRNSRQPDSKKDSSPGLGPLISWRILFLVLPAAVIVGSVLYAAAHYYPQTAFLWGDYEEYYSSLVAKRRALWTVVVISLLTGAIANLFVASLPVLK
jgi:hypothetical protein